MKVLLQYLFTHPKQSLFLAIGWTILIFIGCSLPGKEIPKLGLFDQFDKVVHFSFFFLFFLFWYAWKPSYLGWILLAIVYGFAIEGYQRYCVSGRNFDVWDGVADTLGALAAAGLIFFFSKRLPDEKASSRGR